jgi:hypothetical protein
MISDRDRRIVRQQDAAGIGAFLHVPLTVLNFSTCIKLCWNAVRRAPKNPPRRIPLAGVVRCKRHMSRWCYDDLVNLPPDVISDKLWERLRYQGSAACAGWPS